MRARPRLHGPLALAAAAALSFGAVACDGDDIDELDDITRDQDPATDPEDDPGLDEADDTGASDDEEG